MYLVDQEDNISDKSKISLFEDSKFEEIDGGMQNIKKSCKLEEHKDMEKTGGISNIKDSQEYTSQESSSDYSDEEDDDEMGN